jgi:hypothetical protein
MFSNGACTGYIGKSIYAGALMRVWLAVAVCLVATGAWAQGRNDPQCYQWLYRNIAVEKVAAAFARLNKQIEFVPPGQQSYIKAESDAALERRDSNGLALREPLHA